MNHQEAQKHAEHFFNTYPKVDTFHITTDGQVFAEKHHAESHAISLDKKNPTVHVIDRNIHEVTQEDLDNNPGENEVKVGDKIEIPELTAKEKKAASIQKAKETKAKNAAQKKVNN